MSLALEDPRYGLVEPRPLCTDHVFLLKEVVRSCQSHASLVWCFLPLFAIAQWLVRPLQPTCEQGYSNYSLIAVAFVVAHHVLAESKAWAAAKGLLARPELTVMHHLGVLRRRRQLVFLGILEDLDIYSCLTFPFVAYSCDLMLTEEWLQSWDQVPVVGQLAVKVFEKLRFWGCAAVLTGLVCLEGVVSIIWLGFRSDTLGEKALEVSQVSYRIQQPPRMSGEAFFHLARLAENAILLSVAELCKEMAEQRKWVFDAKSERGGAVGAAKAREELVFGKTDRETFEKHELQNEDERERVEAAGRAYLVVLLLGRILLGNVAQLWLQASFFELSFKNIGREACVKLIAGMTISAVQVLSRSGSAAWRLGCLGCCFAAINLGVVVWALAKVYFAYKCEDHVWNFTTAHCVKMVEVTTTTGVSL